MADGTVISVLLPSRGRPAALRESVVSLRERAAFPSRVKIHVAADDDDQATAAKARHLACKCLVLPRAGYDQLHVYYQHLAAVAAGGWLLIWNDDARMLTSQWDVIITSLPERVLVADIMTPLSPLCCFPAVRRTAVDALGYFCSDNPHVDTFWQDAGRLSGTIEQVQVYAQHDGQIRAGQHHGFYDPPHQAQVRAAAATLREYASALV